MDKETLSNYGWIVICVLVLSVMIALATPFGSFVSNAVQNTTESLFQTQKEAINVTGFGEDVYYFESFRTAADAMNSGDLSTAKEDKSLPIRLVYNKDGHPTIEILKDYTSDRGIPINTDCTINLGSHNIVFPTSYIAISEGVSCTIKGNGATIDLSRDNQNYAFGIVFDDDCNIDFSGFNVVVKSKKPVYAIYTDGDSYATSIKLKDISVYAESYGGVVCATKLYADDILVENCNIENIVKNEQYSNFSLYVRHSDNTTIKNTVCKAYAYGSGEDSGISYGLYANNIKNLSIDDCKLFSDNRAMLVNEIDNATINKVFASSLFNTLYNTNGKIVTTNSTFESCCNAVVINKGDEYLFKNCTFSVKPCNQLKEQSYIAKYNNGQCSTTANVEQGTLNSCVKQYSDTISSFDGCIFETTGNYAIDFDENVENTKNAQLYFSNSNVGKISMKGISDAVKPELYIGKNVSYEVIEEVADDGNFYGKIDDTTYVDTEFCN